MKIYLFKQDHDMTMRSTAQPERAFTSHEAAYNWGKTKGYIKANNSELAPYQVAWEIEELELEIPKDGKIRDPQMAFNLGLLCGLVFFLMALIFR